MILGLEVCWSIAHNFSIPMHNNGSQTTHSVVIIIAHAEKVKSNKNNGKKWRNNYQDHIYEQNALNVPATGHLGWPCSDFMYCMITDFS